MALTAGEVTAIVVCATLGALLIGLVVWSVLGDDVGSYTHTQTSVTKSRRKVPQTRALATPAQHADTAPTNRYNDGYAIPVKVQMWS